MPAELNHPRLRRRGCSKNSDVILGAPEAGGIVLSRVKLNAGSREHLLGIDNIDDFLVSHPAQRRSHQVQRRPLLDRRQIAKLHTIALERQADGAVREVVPPRPRILVEGRHDSGLLPGIERRQKSLGRSDGLGCHVRRRGALWPHTGLYGTERQRKYKYNCQVDTDFHYTLVSTVVMVRFSNPLTSFGCSSR